MFVGLELTISSGSMSYFLRFIYRPTAEFWNTAVSLRRCSDPSSVNRGRRRFNIFDVVWAKKYACLSENMITASCSRDCSPAIWELRHRKAELVDCCLCIPVCSTCKGVLPVCDLEKFSYLFKSGNIFQFRSWMWHPLKREKVVIKKNGRYLCISSARRQGWSFLHSLTILVCLWPCAVILSICGNKH